MAFWTDNDLPEPLRQHRWYIQFGNLSGYQYALKSCSKPEYDIGVSEHVLLNHTFRYPKNLVWKPISVKMIAVTAGNSDDSDTSLSLKFYNLLRSSGYSPPFDVIYNDNNPYKSISKYDLHDSLGTIFIRQINANGIEIEGWGLYNAFINNIKFGSLSYDNDGFVDIDLNITYDYAIITSLASSKNNEEGQKRNNFTIFGLDTGINNFLEPQQKKDFTPGFPGPKK